MKRTALVLVMVAMGTFAHAGQEQYPERTTDIGTSQPNRAGSAESVETSPQRLIYVAVDCSKNPNDANGFVLDVCRAGNGN